jgi:hypothetical protein
MTIHIHGRADGLIEVTCDDEQVVFDPFDLWPTPPIQRSQSRPVVTPKQDGQYGSPPPPPVAFVTIDPYRLQRQPQIVLLSGPTNYQTMDKLVDRIAWQSESRFVYLGLRPESRIELKVLTEIAADKKVNFRLWVPRGEGSE